MHLGPHHHGHGHCSHSDHDLKLNRTFAIAVILNILLVIGEALGGFLSGSMALLADAGHNLSDVAGLVLAWWAHWLRGSRRVGRWTYGKGAFTILAANLNGLLLVATIVGVSAESIHRLVHPTEISAVPVLVVALFAALINFGSASLLSTGGDDLNVRGAYLHMIADAAVSVAVVMGAVLVLFTQWSWVDPVISLAICVVLLYGTWGLLRESTAMMLQAAPANIDLAEVQTYLGGVKEVTEVDDLHVWSASTTDVMLTARVRCPELAAESQDELLTELHAGLQREFGIKHATIELVRDAISGCRCSLDDG